MKHAFFRLNFKIVLFYLAGFPMEAGVEKGGYGII